MEIQLQELFEKIKRDGVDAARAEADRIAAEAQAAKKAVLEEAEREAKAIVEKARADAARMEESGKAALAQASRDLILAFREQLRSILDAVVRADTGQALGTEVVEQALPEILRALASGGAEELAVLLPPATLAKVEARFAARLAAELRKGVELRPDPEMKAGLRVSEKGGAAYYDFSAETVAQLLSRHLNARLAEIVKAAARSL